MPGFSIKHEDRVRLRHMLDAALEIRQYVQSARREDLNRDRKLVHSLVRLFEIIGEAATQISEQLRENIPEIPWFIINWYEKPAHSCLLLDRFGRCMEHFYTGYPIAYNSTEETCWLTTFGLDFPTDGVRDYLKDRRQTRRENRSQRPEHQHQKSK